MLEVFSSDKLNVDVFEDIGIDEYSSLLKPKIDQFIFVMQVKSLLSLIFILTLSFSLCKIFTISFSVQINTFFSNSFSDSPLIHRKF